MRIDHHLAALAELHAQLVQAQPARVGDAPGGREHRVGGQQLPVVQRDAQRGAVALDALQVRAQPHVDALLAHLAGEE